MNDMTGAGSGRGDEDLDDPAVAFGKLTETIHRLSDDVQVLTRTILADRIQRQEELQEIGRRIQAIQAADPREDLGHMGRELGALSKHIDTLSRQPLLAQGPEHLETVITRAGARVSKDTFSSHQAVMADIQFATRDLKEQATRVRTRKRQQWWVAGAAAAGLVLGLLLYPVVAMTLPGGSYLAAAATGQWDQWQAGMQLMGNADPQYRAILDTMLDLYNDNTTAFRSCSNRRERTGQPQDCTVSLTTPLPPLKSQSIDMRNAQPGSG